jgi:hypothetical protein
MLHFAYDIAGRRDVWKNNPGCLLVGRFDLFDYFFCRRCRDQGQSLEPICDELPCCVKTTRLQAARIASTSAANPCPTVSVVIGEGVIGFALTTPHEPLRVLCDSTTDLQMISRVEGSLPASSALRLTSSAIRRISGGLASYQTPSVIRPAKRVIWGEGC